MEQALRVGVVASTHGIKGEVKVFPTTDDVNRFKKLKKVFIDMKREQVTLEIENVKFFKQFAILKFKGYDNINDIQQFVKKDLMIDRADAVPLAKGEFFICDLVGLDVVDEDDNRLGMLKDVLQTAANDVYVVERLEGRELLIPSIPQCILEHNLEQGFIRVHLLPGLLDLN